MNYKILLADDSIAIQKVVELMLSDEDVTLMIADTGEKALEIIQKERPNIIFIDADIPRVDGYEFCKRLREDEELKSIPVILLVAAFGVFDAAKAREVGVSSHLSKPFLAEELLGKIEEVMSEQQKEAERKIEEAEKEIIDITARSLTPSVEEQESVIQDKQEERESRERIVDISDEEKEVFDDLESIDRENDIPFESISLEEEIKKAQESIDLSTFDRDELISSLKDEFNDKFPGKKEILMAFREMAGGSLKETLDDVKVDIKEAVNESLASYYVSRSEVNQLVDDRVKENLGLIGEDIKNGISEKVNDQMSALVVEEIVKEGAYDALFTLLRELIPEIKDNLISTVMRDSLADSLKEVIKTVAWEVIPEIASKIIAEEIQKMKESS